MKLRRLSRKSEAGREAARQNVREPLNKSPKRMRDALKARPPAAKAACLAGPNGTAEAVPFPIPLETNLVRGFLGAPDHFFFQVFSQVLPPFALLQISLLLVETKICAGPGTSV